MTAKRRSDPPLSRFATSDQTRNHPFWNHNELNILHLLEGLLLTPQHLILSGYTFLKTQNVFQEIRKFDIQANSFEAKVQINIWISESQLNSQTNEFWNHNLNYSTTDECGITQQLIVNKKYFLPLQFILYYISKQKTSLLP